MFLTLNDVLGQRNSVAAYTAFGKVIKVSCDKKLLSDDSDFPWLGLQSDSFALGLCVFSYKTYLWKKS